MLKNFGLTQASRPSARCSALRWAYITAGIVYWSIPPVIIFHAPTKTRTWRAAGRTEFSRSSEKVQELQKGAGHAGGGKADRGGVARLPSGVPADPSYMTDLGQFWQVPCRYSERSRAYLRFSHSLPVGLWSAFQPSPVSRPSFPLQTFRLRQALAGRVICAATAFLQINLQF